MRIIGDTNVPFLSYRRIALTISMLVIAAGLAYQFLGPGLNLGIDFTGGTQVTLKFREQVYTEWKAAGKDLSAYPDPEVNPMGLMDAAIDGSELSDAADAAVQTFQADAAREAGIFHHLITLPTYHTAALSTDVLSEGYFGDLGMLAYVRDVQRQEIRKNLASVKHQDLAGSNVGDDHKEYFLGEKALLAGGAANTMNQF